MRWPTPTQVSEEIFHKLYGYLDDDQMAEYCNIYNRSEADEEICLLAGEGLGEKDEL